jgi:deoxyribodipyrimidine photolyase-related protein
MNSPTPTKTIRLILGDQLSLNHSWFQTVDDSILYVLMEIRSETSYVRHHIQKILGIFMAMRQFASHLIELGHDVHYIALNDQENQHDFVKNCQNLSLKYPHAIFERQHADEYRVEELLKNSTSPIFHAVDSEHFLCPQNISDSMKKRIPRMEFFYRDMRRHWNILLTENGEPIGGKWNFDSDNRAKWNGNPHLKKWLGQAPYNATNEQKILLKTLQGLLIEMKVETIGSVTIDDWGWPTTRKQALECLEHFINERLIHFGTYQDAMTDSHPTLFHACLSFALNIKLLNPLEVIQSAINASQKNNIPLNSVEGFIRQILGWREYVRAIYHARMPEYGQMNALNAQKPLPQWFWNGETQMNCLHHSIKQSLELGYAHHIQRLMVTGNFALLAGCHPDAVDEWYLGIYIDAFEWVELPNTRGMSQFADGGLLGSKPYCASATYMQKQGDYCNNCTYQAKKRHGNGACPLNSLYWDFHVRHRDILGKNPRLGMVYRTWDKKTPEEQTATLGQATIYLNQIDRL